jgi:hypothetical protein
MSDKKRSKPGLESKKTLLLHNYDLFLDRQTRLFATANSKALCESEDISTKRELLLLDDLTIFAIAARRLLDLCGLKSAANKFRIAPIRYGSDGKYTRVDEQTVGFETLLNRLIHMSYFQYFDNFRHLKIFAGIKVSNRDLYYRNVTELERDLIDGVFLVQDTNNGSQLYLLKDLVDVSVKVAEKITDTCERADVILDYFVRTA